MKHDILHLIRNRADELRYSPNMMERFSQFLDLLKKTKAPLNVSYYYNQDAEIVVVWAEEDGNTYSVRVTRALRLTDYTGDPADLNQANAVSPAADDPNTAGAPAEGKWVFDEGVANSFTDMLEKSIPGYHDMRDIIYRVGRQVLLDGTRDQPKYFVDLGASNGESAAPFIAGFGGSVHARLLDVSQPMLDRLSVRFREHINAGQVSIRNFDLRQRHDKIAEALRFNEVHYSGASHSDYDSPDLVLAILTMIFVPINFRANVLRGVYQGLRSGGMFIISEKLQGSDYATDNLLVDTYHQLKHDNGYSWEAIERKRLSLEHAQIPLTAEHNERDLRNAGFRHVECVHRHLNFATFVAIK